MTTRWNSRHNHFGKFICFCAAFALLGCASGEAAAPIMRIGGEDYVVKQLTAGTWTATTSQQNSLPGPSGNKAALLQAIEKTSGCKVTDSDYSQAGRQLDAQVACQGVRN